MSHYTQITTNMVDQECIIQALMDQGFTRDQIEVHDQPAVLHGYEEKRRANIIIRKRHTGGYGDLGLLKNPETGRYELIVDDLDQGRRFDKGKLLGRYAYHKAIRAVKKKGLRYQEARDGNGRILLTVEM